MQKSSFTFPHHAPEGLYRPEYEHDACGVAFVTHLDGRPPPLDC